MGQRENLRTLDSAAVPQYPVQQPPTSDWYQWIWTPDGAARIWRLIPAQAFTQCILFQRLGIVRDTLGDVPPENDQQLAELAAFVGRSLACIDRDVNRYQGKKGALYIRVTWPVPEIMRVAKEAAIFNGLRLPESEQAESGAQIEATSATSAAAEANAGQ